MNSIVDIFTIPPTFISYYLKSNWLGKWTVGIRSNFQKKKQNPQHSFLSILYLLSKPVCTQSLSHVWLFATIWTVARQAPLSMGFCRQEYWSGLPCPPPGDLPAPGIQSSSLASPTLAGGFFTTVPPRRPPFLKPNCHLKNPHHVCMVL